MEGLARAEGRDLETYSTDELNVLWDQIKDGEHVASQTKASE